jgi:hypothetical protein
LKQRFSEGMRIKIAYENGKSVGFIEYTPGEFAWRAIDAEDYMVIHCLWVVGRWKKKGYGSRLLGECIEDAREMGKRGVAVVTKSGGFLVGKKIFLKYGFEKVDQAPPSFELMVKKFGDVPSPGFPQDWEARAGRYGSGLTVIRSDQCPYIDSSVEKVLEVAAEMDIGARVDEYQTPREVRDSAPSPYGIFSLVYDGELLSFRPVTRKELVKLLEERAS